MANYPLLEQPMSPPFQRARYRTEPSRQTKGNVCDSGRVERRQLARLCEKKGGGRASSGDCGVIEDKAKRTTRKTRMLRSRTTRSVVFPALPPPGASTICPVIAHNVCSHHSLECLGPPFSCRVSVFCVSSQDRVAARYFVEGGGGFLASSTLSLPPTAQTLSKCIWCNSSVCVGRGEGGGGRCWSK